MIQVSTEVANALNQTSRQFDAKIYVNGSAVDCEIMSLKLHKGACGKFTVGSIFIPYVELTINGNVTLNSYFEIRMAVKVGNSFSTYYSLGSFKVTSQEVKGNAVEIYAQGHLAEMASETLYELEPTARSLQNILTAIRSKGYTITIKDLTIPNASIAQDSPLAGISVREGLGIVALCSGGYVTEDTSGNIVLGKFETVTSALTVDEDRFTENPSIKGEYILTGITIKTQDEAEYTIGTNPNLEVTNPYFNNDMVAGFTSNTIGYRFNVTDSPMALGDFRLEPWDYVEVELGEETYKVPCLTLDFEFDGGLQTRITSDGELPSETNSKTGGVITELANSAYQKATAVSSIAKDALDTATDALDTADQANQTVNGTPTYVYIHSGVQEVVYKRANGTYYYMSEDEGESIEVDVSEENLVHDEDGNLVVNVEGGIEGVQTSVYDERVYANSILARLETYIRDSGLSLSQLNQMVVDNSLIALGKAELIDNDLGLLLKGQNPTTGATSAMQLTPAGIELSHDDRPIIVLADVNGEGVMNAKKVNISVLRFKSENSIYSDSQIGGFGWIAREDGHLSLKAVN